MRRLAFIFLLITGCSSLSQMEDTIQRSSAVIEQNTQKMEETGLIIAENTREIKIYTRVMQFVFPIIWFSLFLFGYVLYRKTIKAINSKK